MNLVDFVRAGCNQVCEKCGKPYWRHPHDRSEAALDYEGRPFLRILCNGVRVKL